ncbi:F-box/LRR-repeat protein-like [Iris pallida]|uniref:F-box/LRR-repeat protein-like n=1 Tax=Iris pallida TaxID=29817 RepID=A0AAX6DYZ3_IRIPA|nr:F-box/LRR-repeat protein-like [Iris pallida]
MDSQKEITLYQLYIETILILRVRSAAMEEERRWEDLGIDCLGSVFSRLDLEDLTLSVPFVCKPWLEASMDVLCWRVLNLRDMDLMPWSSFSTRFKQAYNTKHFSFTGFMKTLIDRGRGSTVELAFSTERFASLQELEYASINCLKLKVLGLPNMFQEEDKHLPGFIEKWKDLEFLTMGRKPSSFLEIIERISLNCSSFRGLCLSGRIDSEDAFAIAKHLPKLKCLVMSGCSLGKRELLAILDGCRELQAVDVSNCTGFVPDDEIMRIASFVGEFKHEGAKMEEEYMVYYGDVYWGMDC